MAPTFVLIVVFLFNTDTGMTSQSIPMVSLEVCKREAAKFEKSFKDHGPGVTYCVQTN